MRINKPKDFFNHSGITASALTLDAVQVRLAMEQLRGLGKLSIYLWTRHWLYTTKHESPGRLDTCNTATLELTRRSETSARSCSLRWT